MTMRWSLLLVGIVTRRMPSPVRRHRCYAHGSKKHRRSRKKAVLKTLAVAPVMIPDTEGTSET